MNVKTFLRIQCVTPKCARHFCCENDDQQNQKFYQEISNLLIAIINKVTLYALTHTQTQTLQEYAFTLHANITLQCQFHHSVSLITVDHY